MQPVAWAPYPRVVANSETWGSGGGRARRHRTPSIPPRTSPLAGRERPDGRGSLTSCRPFTHCAPLAPRLESLAPEGLGGGAAAQRAGPRINFPSPHSRSRETAKKSSSTVTSRPVLTNSSRDGGTSDPHPIRHPLRLLGHRSQRWQLRPTHRFLALGLRSWGRRRAGWATPQHTPCRCSLLV